MLFRIHLPYMYNTQGDLLLGRILVKILADLLEMPLGAVVRGCIEVKFFYFF